MKNLIYLVIFVSTLSFGQRVSIEPTIKVTYATHLNLGEKNIQNENFILVGNTKEFYFGIEKMYLLDSDTYKAKDGIDFNSNSVIFNQRIIKTDGKINVFAKAVDLMIRYEETEPIKWVLYGVTKTISGIKCQLATTNRFGRRWYAFFAKDYTQQIGPYKFSGLPGLILELYDIRKDYHFVATKIEKYTDDFDFNLNKFTLMSKKNYLKAKYNMEFTIAAFPPMDGPLLKETEDMYKKLRIMFNNPIELKPFEY